MSLSLEITLDNDLYMVKDEIDDEILMFLEFYRKDSNFLGHQVWYKVFIDHITIEMLHFRLKKTLSSMW